MTTPEETTGFSEKAGGPRNGPNRAGSGANGGTKSNGGASDALGKAVKSGYDAVAANIVQARIAAEKFRQGAYNVSAVPADLTAMSQRMPDVISNFSAAGIELLQSLISAAGSSAGAAGGSINLKVDFGDNADRAGALTDTLARPKESAWPDAITCDGLTKPGAASQIDKVLFNYDVSTGELVAAVTVPDNLQSGVYSGIVYAKNQDTPLGTLSVRVGDQKK